MAGKIECGQGWAWQGRAVGENGTTVIEQQFKNFKKRVEKKFCKDSTVCNYSISICP